MFIFFPNLSTHQELEIQFLEFALNNNFSHLGFNYCICKMGAMCKHFSLGDRPLQMWLGVASLAKLLILRLWIQMSKAPRLEMLVKNRTGTLCPDLAQSLVF